VKNKKAPMPKKPMNPAYKEEMRPKKSNTGGKKKMIDGKKK
jgi:hypothetical protein